MCAPASVIFLPLYTSPCTISQFTLYKENNRPHPISLTFYTEALCSYFNCTWGRNPTLSENLFFDFTSNFWTWCVLCALPIPMASMFFAAQGIDCSCLIFLWPCFRETAREESAIRKIIPFVHCLLWQHLAPFICKIRLRWWIMAQISTWRYREDLVN